MWLPMSNPRLQCSVNICRTPNSNTKLRVSFQKSILRDLMIYLVYCYIMLNIYAEFHISSKCQTTVIVPGTLFCGEKKTNSELCGDLELRSCPVSNSEKKCSSAMSCSSLMILGQNFQSYRVHGQTWRSTV